MDKTEKIAAVVLAVSIPAYIAFVISIKNKTKKLNARMNSSKEIQALAERILDMEPGDPNANIAFEALRDRFESYVSTYYYK